MGRCHLVMSAEQSFFHFHCVQKRQHISDLFKYPAHQFNVEPHAGQPCGKVGQQRTANTADLFRTEDTAAQKAQRNIEDRYWKDPENSIPDPYADRQA